jgi:AcrR family transcriptional regulator
MAAQGKRHRARAKRHQGASVREIARQLNVSRGTVSYWCRDIALTHAQQRRLAQRRGKAGIANMVSAAQAKRQWRELYERVYYDRGVRDIQTRTVHDDFPIGLALFTGIGHQTMRRVQFASPDPALVHYLVRWLSTHYDIAPERFRVRVAVAANAERTDDALRQYWHEVTGVAHTHITINRTAARKQLTATGTPRITVRESASIAQRIRGAIDALFPQQQTSAEEL